MEASSFLFPSPRWGRTFCFVTVILHRRDDGRKIEQDDREKREKRGNLEKPISNRCRSRSVDWRVIDVKKEQLFRREMSLPANGKRKTFLDFELNASFRAWLMAIIN